MKEGNMMLDTEHKLVETRLVQVRTELEREPILGALDPKPIEEIVRDIVRLFRDSKGYNQAKDRRYAVEILAAFHARVAIAQYPEKFKAKGMDEDDYREILDLCVQHLLHCDCPAEESIQLQVTVQTSLYRSTNKYVESTNKNKETLDIIMGLICDTKAVDSRKLYETVEYLHGRMVEYLLELSRLTDQNYTDTDPQLLEADIIAALESVLPKKGLLYWMDLPHEEKVLQMEELADVVMGIRVFNKCMKRGGELFTLPYERFEVESEELRNKVQEVIQFVDSRVANCILGIRNHVEEYGDGHMFITRLKDELTYFMQAALYLLSLDAFLIQRLKEVNDVSENCAQCIDRICGTIDYRKCIPAELVYPELRRIGMYQRNTLEEYNLLRAHSRAAIPLFELSEKPQFILVPMGSRRLQIMAKNFLFLPRGAAVTCPVDSILEYGGKQRATLIVDGPEVNSLKPQLEFGGLCPVTLVRRNGLLMRGDTRIGLVQVDDKVFSFADDDAMGRFLRAPQAYLQSIHSFVMKMPQLIHIMGMHERLAYAFVSIPKILRLINDPLPSDFGTQTCTHALPIHRWDEESLEKRLQELKKMKTDSSQTKESHFHRHNDSQVWPPKDQWTQTSVSRGTTMAHHVRVLHNLRGDIHETPKIIKATFEMHDDINPL